MSRRTQPSGDFGEMSRRGRPRAQGPAPPSPEGGRFLDGEMPKLSVKGPVGGAESRRKAIPHEGNMQ